MPKSLLLYHKNEISDAAVVYCPCVKYYSKDIYNRCQRLCRSKIKNFKKDTRNLTSVVYLRQNTAICITNKTTVKRLLNNKSYRSCAINYISSLKNWSNQFRIITARFHENLCEIKPYARTYSDVKQYESNNQILTFCEHFLKTWTNITQWRSSLLARRYGVRYERYQLSLQELSTFIHGYLAFKRFISYLLRNQIAGATVESLKRYSDQSNDDIRTHLQTRQLISSTLTANSDITSSLPHASIVGGLNCQPADIIQYWNNYLNNLVITCTSHKRKQSDVYFYNIYLSTRCKKQKLTRKRTISLLTKSMFEIVLVSN